MCLKGFVVFNDILFALNQYDNVFKCLVTAVIRLGSKVSNAYTVESFTGLIFSLTLLYNLQIVFYTIDSP